MVKLIACIGPNGELGLNNDLIYHNKKDMKFFKDQTMNNVVIMGRKTFASLNCKPLPNRINIVLTSQELVCPGVLFWNIPLGNAIENAKEIFPMCDICIIGGALIYNQAIEQKLADELFITRMIKEKPADTYINIEMLESNYKDFVTVDVLMEDKNDIGVIYKMIRR